MKSRILCPECRLTIFARNENKLDKMAGRFKCNCGKPLPDVLPERLKDYIGRQSINISSAIFLVKDLYE